MNRYPERWLDRWRFLWAGSPGSGGCTAHWWSTECSDCGLHWLWQWHSVQPHALLRHSVSQSAVKIRWCMCLLYFNSNFSAKCSYICNYEYDHKNPHRFLLTKICLKNPTRYNWKLLLRVQHKLTQFYNWLNDLFKGRVAVYLELLTLYWSLTVSW